MRLHDGDRVAVVGGGPAGSFFALSLLNMARRLGLDLDVVVHEPRDFSRAGPRSCNMCGGIISESLIQSLAADGIHLPPEVIQRRLDSYVLHTDAGSVRIATPLQEKRIASVHRGSGPRGFQTLNSHSFDAHLLELARRAGARRAKHKVETIGWEDGRPALRFRDGRTEAYELAAMAVGVNTPGPRLTDIPGFAYRRPLRTRAFVTEFHLGASMVQMYLGDAMHLFLLDLRGLEFAAIIPKSNYATLCLLGKRIEPDLVRAFLESEEVRRCMPPHWSPPPETCHCSPHLNVGAAVQPFGERMVFVGDCAATRLYKDGIGAAWRTARAAARTAIFRGVAAEDFRSHYWPTCRAIEKDNRLGRVVYAVTRQIQRRRFARRGLWRMVSKEQKRRTGGAMSSVMWDVFTGSAPYRDVLLRTLKPSFLATFALEMARPERAADASRVGRTKMASGHTGLMGRKILDGEVIYHQGDRGDCMFVIQGGQVELTRRETHREYSLAVLDDGDFFGEMALFGDEVRHATARAVGTVWVYTLEREALLRRIHEDPSLAFRIIQKLARRVRELEAALIREAKVAT